MPDPAHCTDDVIRQSLTIVRRNVFKNIDRNWMLTISDIEIADLVAPLRWNEVERAFRIIAKWVDVENTIATRAILRKQI